MQLDPEVTKLLLEGDSVQSVLLGLLAIRKDRQKTFSLSILAKKSGFSKSFLSEVISGKKKLLSKNLEHLAAPLGMGYLETKCLEGLLLLEKSKSDEERFLKNHELESARRVLRLVASESVNSGLRLLEFDVYAAFGVFQGSPTKEQLFSIFPNLPKLEVQNALYSLLEKNAVKANGDDTFSYSSSGLVVNATDRAGAFLEIWKQSLQDATRQLPKWASHKESSCFASYVVSVNLKKYQDCLENFKNQIFQFASVCDSNEADTLVRINVQIYPVTVPVVAPNQVPDSKSSS
jgi:uncharacterized protein (TIGR02147 family)